MTEAIDGGMTKTLPTRYGKARKWVFLGPDLTIARRQRAHRGDLLGVDPGT